MNRDIVYRDWSSGADFGRGTHQGTAVHDGCLVIGGQPAGTRCYVDPHGDPGDPGGPHGDTHGGPHGDGSPVAYEQSTWLSPEVRPGFAFTELVPSWNAATPEGTWVEVEARVSADGIHMSRWHALGRWAETDTDIHPTSVAAQDDGLACVETEILAAREPSTLASYQLRVSLLRRRGSSGTPTVRLVGVMASNVPSDGPVSTSGPGDARGVVLDVPGFSQQLHRGEYPQWGDSGGESWCSPTATSMLLAFWGTGPDEAEYAWVDPGLSDRWVDHAARHTFDHSYRGAGNWSFNTAYAARYGLRAFVTRLRSLTEAEQFIRAGIPLVVSVSFKEGDLDGAGYDTEGHLLTVVGFDESGNVVSNDPASHQVASNDAVRTTYDRAQFERVWLGSAGGIAYVIHPPDHPLPQRPVQPNW